MTVSDDVEAYKRAYADFFQEVQPIVSRMPGGGVIIRLLHGEPLHWSMDEVRLMTGFYRQMMEEERAA
jgi:hypothetical protein